MSSSSSAGASCHSTAKGGLACPTTSASLMNTNFWYHPNNDDGPDFAWEEANGVWTVKVQVDNDHEDLRDPPQASPYPPVHKPYKLGMGTANERATVRHRYDLATYCCFSDFYLELKFRCPDLRTVWRHNEGSPDPVHVQGDRAPTCNGPLFGIRNWGNSGVYLLYSYEIQILDSYNDGSQTVVDPLELGTDGCEVPANEICGAIYKKTAPSVNAVVQASNHATATPPKPADDADWNHMKILFMSPRWTDETRTTPTKKATVSVWLNNGTSTTYNLHDKVGIDSKTGQKEPGSLGMVDDNIYDEGWKKAVGPIVLQEHDNRVQFKDITIDPGHAFGTDFQVDA